MQSMADGQFSVYSARSWVENVFFPYTDRNVIVMYIKLFSFDIIKGYKKVLLKLTANPETIAPLIPTVT